MTILAGTGHRPNKLGGYSASASNRLRELAISELRRIEPSIVISGMAIGWDQALAEAAITLQIPLHAYTPFIGQEAAWPFESRSRFNRIMARASRVVVVSPGNYAAWKMQRRNERMVDDCTVLLALWDGSDGGTANCVRYAQRVQRSINNCWSRF